MPGNRKAIRLKNYDYTQQGAYYVTVCVHDRKCIFGDVQDDEMVLSDMGKIAEFTWMDLSRHNTNIKLDKFIVMPNHLHGIIKIVREGHGLPEIVRQFKTFTAKRINQTNQTQGSRLWQRNYYEHVIRDEDDLNRIREYIINNAMKWEEDEYYPG